ncbi:EpsG family protein [Campylobacter ureolyticus]|uniref:EpsG family protein n=1 Tax=Campylobacter ureolyticus TaxID=827 RepID=UPI0022B34DB6|nr:EpsG family protein [Campylobacter ureolyticus]MCZ6173751.1 EpsG family protein [Campylobacter ureolyticus]MCZ6186318.1 EpsG family protein [Campylobacter ureolyticus]
MKDSLINYTYIKIFYLFLIFISFMLMLFYPLLSFCVCISILVIFSKISKKIFTSILFFISTFSLLIIYASRDYKEEMEHDLNLYFNIFQNFINNNYSDFFFFGNGLEIGWTFLYSTVAKIFPCLTPPNLAILNSLFCIFLLFFWIKSYIYENITYRDQGLVVGLIVLFLSMTTFGYLQRQALATIFLLFMITSKNKKVIFLFLATIFHSTSLVLGCIYLTLIKIKLNNKKIILLLLLFIFIRFIFYNFVSFIANNNIDFFIFSKVYYYLVAEPTISSKRFLILVFPLFVLSFFNNKNRNILLWKSIIQYSCISYMVLLGIPLLSERLNFIFLFIYGYFIYLVVPKKFYFILYFFIFLYLIFFFCEKSNLLVDLNLFWQRYTMFSCKPLYFLELI